MQFVDVETKNIAKELQQSSFLSGASMATFFCHIRIVTFFLHCPSALHYIETEGLDIFGINHLGDVNLMSNENEDAVYI